MRRAATFHVRNAMAGGEADEVFTYGRAGDEVLVGDWRGAGNDSFAVRRGKFYHVNYSLRGGDADHVVGFGHETDEVYVGDWDGDSIDTLGVRRPLGS